MGQILAEISTQFLTRQLQDELKYQTQKLLFDKMDLNATDMTNRESLVGHLITENLKTSATVAGVDARVTAQAAGAQAGTAIQAATGSVSIMNDAKTAAAGAYQAVVGIPVIGPILAPIAAGTAFAAVAAFDTLTSLDVGAWEVPQDMPAMIHAGESVVPKDFASGLRDAIGGGGNPGSGGMTVNIQTLDTVTMAAWAQRNSGMLAGAVRNHIMLNPSFGLGG